MCIAIIGMLLTPISESFGETPGSVRHIPFLLNRGTVPKGPAHYRSEASSSPEESTLRSKARIQSSEDGCRFDLWESTFTPGHKPDL